MDKPPSPPRRRSPGRDAASHRPWGRQPEPWSSDGRRDEARAPAWRRDSGLRPGGRDRDRDESARASGGAAWERRGDPDSGRWGHDMFFEEGETRDDAHGRGRAGGSRGGAPAYGGGPLGKTKEERDQEWAEKRKRMEALLART